MTNEVLHVLLWMMWMNTRTCRPPKVTKLPSLSHARAHLKAAAAKGVKPKAAPKPGACTRCERKRTFQKGCSVTTTGADNNIFVPWTAACRQQAEEGGKCLASRPRRRGGMHVRESPPDRRGLQACASLSTRMIITKPFCRYTYCTFCTCSHVCSQYWQVRPEACSMGVIRLYADRGSCTSCASYMGLHAEHFQHKCRMYRTGSQAHQRLSRGRLPQLARAARSSSSSSSSLIRRFSRGAQAGRAARRQMGALAAAAETLSDAAVWYALKVCFCSQ